MGQINFHSDYLAEAIQPDRKVGDRKGQSQRRPPRHQKPKPTAEDQVELHDHAPSPPAPAAPTAAMDEFGHLDITA